MTDIALPPFSAAAANYLPWRRSGNLVYIAGQIARDAAGNVAPFLGRLGAEFDTAQGSAAARACGLHVLSALANALDGDLGRVVACVRVGGFVAATPEFTDHSQVINGVSDLLVETLGQRGAHARAAVGVASLPRGVCVEVEAIFEVH